MGSWHVYKVILYVDMANESFLAQFYPSLVIALANLNNLIKFVSEQKVLQRKWNDMCVFDTLGN